MKKFIYDVVLEASDICNLENEVKILEKEISQGRRVVMYGRRNTGKTSLVQAIILPHFLSKNKKLLIIDVDMMGVSSLQEIQRRLRIAFERGLSKANPGQSYLSVLIKSIRGIRPALNLSPTSGELSFSLGIDTGAAEPELEDLFSAIVKYHKAHGTLIVFDEFQDISEIKGAQALIRGVLQRLPSDLPVIILGSKKNLLAKIFAVPQAPLAGWGRDVQIPDL